jgi:microcystin-dependent protein
MTVSVILPGQTGGTTDYAVPFEYLARSHVKATVNGAPVSFTFNSTYMIRISPAPVGTVAIYRETPSDEPINVFTDGSILVADELNAAFLQSLFVSQEVAEKLPGRDTGGNWDMGNRRLINIATPVNPNDAVNKAFAEEQRALADAARVAAEAARDAALEHRNSAQGFAGAASSSASMAATKADEAAASAALAATFNPTSYYTRTQSDARYYTSTAVDALLASNFYTQSQVNSLIGSIQSGTPGDIIFTAAETAPAGTLVANGAAVSRATYSALFARIGTTYGVGDGSTTFNLPDYRSYFLRGLDLSRGLDAGRVLGSIQASQNLAHNHTGTTDSQGAHTHGASSSNGGSGNGSVISSTNGSGAAGSISVNSAGAHSHNLTIASSGGTEARPINIAVLICIKF